MVKGASPASLPATYHAERNPVGARVLKHMMELTALNRGDDRTNALRETMSEVMQMDGPRKWYTAMMSGLDIRYDLGQGHPLLGRRMPDLDLITDDGPLRLFSLLQDARPVLLDFGGSGRFEAPGWEDRDVAWVGDQTRQGLTDVLTAWFGQHEAG